MNKSALVLGGTSGLGLKSAIELASRGFDICIAGRDPERLENAVQAVTSETGKPIRGFAVDAASSDSVNLIRAEVGEYLDALVICVGSGRPVNSGTLAGDLNASLQKNFIPILNAWDAVCEPLKQSNGSAVIVSSIAGIEDLGAPVEYSLSKSLIAPFVRLVARRTPEVRVNAIAPGNILTESSAWSIRKSEDPDALERFLHDNVPLSRLSSPEEIAVLVSDMASGRFPFMTGTTVVIDGGQTRCLW